MGPKMLRGGPHLLRKEIQVFGRSGCSRGWMRDRDEEVVEMMRHDDPRSQEADFIAAGERGTWIYLHQRRGDYRGHPVYGYAHVPPTPFLNKDWERYDVSRYVDPGCVSPEEGYRSVAVDASVSRYKTIAEDLKNLCGDDDLAKAILLFHTPPYQTNLDRTGGLKTSLLLTVTRIFGLAVWLTHSQCLRMRQCTSREAEACRVHDD